MKAIPSDPRAAIGTTAVGVLLGVGRIQVWRYYTEETYAHLNFPRPAVVLGRPRWTLGDILSWRDARRPVAGQAA